MEANLRKQIELPKSTLTVVHVSTDKTFYSVEDADIKGKSVEVSYYNEADEAACKNIKLDVVDLLDFISDTYGNWISTGYSVDRVEYEGSDIDYLCDNLKTICEEFINSGKGAINA
jgi:hypothetical protein